MTGFRARRGAEAFHSTVEARSTDAAADPRHAELHAELLELVGALRSSPQVEPRGAFVHDLRERLMVEAATALTPTAARLALPPRTRAPRERRLAVAVGGFAVISATASMAVAAQSALPGDALYPLKRALENASTTIHVDQDDRGASLLDHASGRLQEVAALTRSSDQDVPGAVNRTLHSFTDQAATASDLMLAAFEQDGRASSIEQLRSFATDSMGQLRELESLVPESSRAALIEATQVVSQIDATAAAVCPSCGQGVGELPAAALSPVDDLIEGLGQQLAVSEPTAAPTEAGDRRGERGRGEGPAQPNPSVDVPDLPIQDGAGGAGRADGETPRAKPPGTRGGGSNPVTRLTEGLTGGVDVRGPRTRGSLDDVLQGPVDGLDEMLDGLEGPDTD